VKRRLLGSVASSALLASSAIAADMPVKALPPALYNWTGFYAGLNAGGAWGWSDPATVVSCAPVPGFLPYFCNPVGGQANAAAVNAAGTGSMSGSAFAGGGQVGYNVQHRNLVFGVELDVEAFNLRLSRQASGTYPLNFLSGMAGRTFTVASSVNTDWLFTARVRAGWAFDTVLVYATVGVAATELRASHAFTDNVAPPFFGAGIWSASATKTGLAAGVGAEWAAWRKWTVKVEYLYLNFGSVSASGLIFNRVPLGYAQGISTSADLTAHIARAGINFHF
jgi:outer membrane immunogenic protein